MKIEVNTDISNYIESLQYETFARRDIISFMLSNNIDMSTQSAKKYQDEYSDFYAKYEVSMQELREQYIDSNKDLVDKKINWSLDFKTHILDIEVL